MSELYYAAACQTDFASPDDRHGIAANTRRMCEIVEQTIVGYELLDEWANERAVAQEYDISVAVGGTAETHRVIGILFAEESPAGTLLGGERIYASERCVRQMAGDLRGARPLVGVAWKT